MWLPQFNPTYGVELIKQFFVIFSKIKYNFLVCQIFVMLSRDLSSDIFCSRQAFPLINLIELLALGWPFYNCFFSNIIQDFQS